MKTFVIAALAVAALAGAAPAFAQVNGRESGEQGRINQGVESGQLTHREAGNLERQQDRIDHTVARERHSNGGYLTRRERMRIAQRQRMASRHIYRLKHNRRHY